VKSHVRNAAVSSYSCQKTFKQHTSYQQSATHTHTHTHAATHFVPTVM